MTSLFVYNFYYMKSLPVLFLLYDNFAHITFTIMFAFLSWIRQTKYIISISYRSNWITSISNKLDLPNRTYVVFSTWPASLLDLIWLFSFPYRNLLFPIKQSLFVCPLSPQFQQTHFLKYRRNTHHVLVVVTFLSMESFLHPSCFEFVRANAPLD